MHTMGALYWQLNDVWVAPSWSSIEYNGQFKLLHHWIKDVFAPLSMIVRFNKLKKVEIYCSNDIISDWDPRQPLTIVMKVFKWSSFTVVADQTWIFDMPENSVKLIDTLDIYQFLELRELARNEHIIEFILTGVDPEKVLAKEFVFPEPIKDAVGVSTTPDNVQLRIGHQRCAFNVSTVSLEIRANAPAIFVYLQLKDSANIERYELSKNGFMQLEPINVVHMQFDNSGCGVELQATDFEVMTVNQFMVKRNGKGGTCGAK
jgi:beta-mannosidase